MKILVDFIIQNNLVEAKFCFEEKLKNKILNTLEKKKKMTKLEITYPVQSDLSTREFRSGSSDGVMYND